MFCEHCGKEIDNNSEFCIHCGMPVEPVASKPKTQRKLSDFAQQKKAADPAPVRVQNAVYTNAGNQVKGAGPAGMMAAYFAAR